MSLLNKRWHILNQDKEKDLFLKLLENRNLKDEKEIEEFLNTNFENGLHDPFLLKDMEKAVEKIFDCIEKSEKIIIFGDYDADGITGTAILYSILEQLGAKVSYRLPHRVEDGYGLNTKIIDELAEIGVNLLITVDCGICNENQIKYAKTKNIDVIITDHHSLPENPPSSAYAIIHSKQSACNYPYKELTGAGIAFKLASALILKSNLEDKTKEIINLLDLTAMGTVADLGPLTGENRIIVKYGLEMINKGSRESLNFLKKSAFLKCDTEITGENVGFYLTPRLNAAGRIHSAYLALQFLLSNGEIARDKAEDLEKINKSRQQMTEELFKDAENKIQEDLENKKIIIAHGKNWHVGIIGLVASKLVEKYNLPAIIMNETENILIGSCRSPEFFNMIEALTANKEFLSHFGGHKQAAGFTLKLENKEKFFESMEKYASDLFPNIKIDPVLKIDCEIESHELKLETASKIEQFSPFGIGNTQPTFLYKQAKIDNLRKVGKEGKHLACDFFINNTKLRCIAFSFGEFMEKLGSAKNLDLVLQMNKKTWNGMRSLELKIIDAEVK